MVLATLFLLALARRTCDNAMTSVHMIPRKSKYEIFLLSRKWFWKGLCIPVGKKQLCLEANISAMREGINKILDAFY